MDTQENTEISEVSDFIINEIELEKIYSKLISTVKNIQEAGVERTASAVIYGYYKGWNLSKAIKYYNLEEDLAKNLWKHFNFKLKEGGQTMSRTKTKQNNIVNYLEKNVGQVVTPAKVSTDVSISLPTFYNFYNANRQFFKKVKRGQFEIVNPKEQRDSELNS
jgi:hypothetical protein